MKTDLNKISSSKNERVGSGQVPEASQKHFAQNAITTDVDATITNNNAEIVSEMQNFAGSIDQINGITLQDDALNGNVSFAMFTGWQ